MVSGNDLRAAMGKFATGVTLIAALRDDGSVQSMTANSVTSLSLDPPLVLVCLSHTCNTLPYLRSTGRYSINVLDRSQSEAATFYAKPDEKRAGPDPVEYSFNDRGSPIVRGCLSFLDCDVVAAHEHGDHTIFVGAVRDTGTDSGDPLVFYEGHYSGVDGA